MQEGQNLSTQFRLIPYRSRDDEPSEEKAEDQLDRLMASVQQVLAGAKMMQLEDFEPPPATNSAFGHARSRTRRNSDHLDSEDLNTSGLRSQTSEFEPFDYENIEIIDFLAVLLEKTQMENEDLRSLSLRTAATHVEQIEEVKRRTLKDLWVKSDLVRDENISEERFVEAIKALRTWHINCTMEEVCESEYALFDVLTNPTQDANTELKLGTRTVEISVQKKSGEQLPVSKRRIAANVSSSLSPSSDFPQFRFDDSPLSLSSPTGVSHTDCERTIEELRHRLDFMRLHTIPAEALHHLDYERQRIRKAQTVMKAEVESLQLAKRDLDELKTVLSTHMAEVKRAAQQLSEEHSRVQDLKVKLTQKQASLTALEKSLEADRKFMEMEKTEFMHIAAVQGEEVVTLRQKIEELVNSHTANANESYSFLDVLPEGDLRELDLRVKHAVSVIEAESGSVEEVTRVLNEVEDALCRINPRKSGFRRVKVQLTSARNKLVNWKSQIALAQANRMMSNLNSNIRVLGKTWKQPPPLEQLDFPQKPIVDFEEIHKTAAETPQTPSKTFDFPINTPGTEERESGGKWITFTETIRRQDFMITRLRQQLEHASIRLKHLDQRESKVREKEELLHTFEKQLEVVSLGLEKRMKLISSKEASLKQRELHLLSYERTGDKGASPGKLLEQLYMKLHEDEAGVWQQRTEVQQEKVELAGLREELTAKEKSLERLQQVLSRESLKVAADQQKMVRLRQELYHLMPTLDPLGSNRQ